MQSIVSRLQTICSDCNIKRVLHKSHLNDWYEIAITVGVTTITVRKYVDTGLGEGVVPQRRQAIAGINNEALHWCIDTRLEAWNCFRNLLFVNYVDYRNVANHFASFPTYVTTCNFSPPYYSKQAFRCTDLLDLSIP